MEKARAGLVDLSILHQKSPSFASIPKRTYQDTDPSLDFDLSGIDSILGLSKVKRQRRFAYVPDGETRHLAEAFQVKKGLKILTSLAGKKVQALLDKCGSRGEDSSQEKVTQSEHAEQHPLEQDQAMSEDDELVIIGGDFGGGDDEVSNVGGGQDDDGPTGHPEGGQEDHIPPPELNPPELQGRDYNNDRTINIKPNTIMRDNFRKYCQIRRGSKHNSFTKSEQRAVRLMGVLKGTRAALNTYDAILDWHHRENGDIGKRESLKHVNNVDKYHSRKKMIKTLTDRYHLTSKGAKQSTITLPNSKAKVTLTFHNAWDCIESLLTDPRVKDSDYSFHNNNPLARPPPVNLNGNISELHTAKAYHEAYEKFIKVPGKQVLLPIVMYIDGAITGQFSSLPVTALKLSLGIYNKKFREKEFAWRTLGYVAQVSTPTSRGNEVFYETRHMEADFVRLVRGEGGEEVRDDVCKAQDFHTMLDCLLTSYVEVQNNGFVWDLRYRGETYKDIEFVPFVMFVKCDTEEADVLCGSYTSRQRGVAQLCRYCTCPTEESDHVFALYPQKTVKMIQDLVDAQDFDGLQKLSQQCIQNAWYKIRFHPYNKQGIHGACPSELLHAMLLGVFKYTRECFFQQIGPSSKAADDINNLAQVYGNLFARQAERDKPNCSFKDGIIKSGRIMAKEFRGILLVMAAILRSQKGQNVLSRKENFASPQAYKDWVLLVEMLLQWEAFLNSSEMTVRHVRRLQKKNRYLMYLIKKVANRTKGMGMKLTKFHVIMHMWFDIYLFGVPTEVDTGSNESHHKLAKIAARLTQKNETTFDFQTCTRLDEFHLIDLALAELNDNLKLWDYYTKPADLDPEHPRVPSPRTGGTIIQVFQDPEFGEDPVFSLGAGKKVRKPLDLPWNKDVVRFLFDLQKKLKVNNIQIRGEHKREGMIFRGHPNYRDKPWRDWATIDWGDKELPGQIWCFVVIDFDPYITDDEGNDVIVYHGGIRVAKGCYAVVESAAYDDRNNEKAKSDLFIPIRKEIIHCRKSPGGWRRKFYLADVESITCPLAVVPNVGVNRRFDYLILKSRSEWVDIFKKWLDDPHENDRIPLTEPIPACSVFNC